MSDEILLRCGDLTAGISPATGGSITGFFSGEGDNRTDWLRTASDDALAAVDPRGMAAFPLVPFSSRVRDGRFEFQGKSVQLPLNFGNHPHAIHGQGWQNPWTRESQTAETLTIVYNHDADAWPWTWQGRQVFSLSEDCLTVAISLTNTSDSDMPVGLGLHPYFPRTKGVTIKAKVNGMWLVDDEVMPLELVPPQSPTDPTPGIEIDKVTLDNGYTGWQGRAEIHWPDRTRSLVMTATDLLDQLVIFTPEGEDFFCVEPVSHSTDAVNAEEDRGLVILAPGETCSATVKFSIV